MESMKCLFHAWKDDEPEDVYEKMLYYLKRVHDQLRYDSSATDVRTSAEDAVKIGAGVCQDYSHVLLSLLRMAGMPARYRMPTPATIGVSEYHPSGYCSFRGLQAQQY